MESFLFFLRCCTFLIAFANKILQFGLSSELDAFVYLYRHDLYQFSVLFFDNGVFMEHYF